jgi:ABC-2 type transport system permease protein
MTTAVIPCTTSPAGPARGVTPLRVLRSEWTKLRSLRSSIAVLAVAVVVTVGVGAVIAAIHVGHYASTSTGDRARFDPVAASLIGLSIAELAIGVLGVLAVTGEYSTGMIRSSVTVVPRRLPLLWAKIAVVAAVSFTVMLVASLAAFLISQAVLDRQGLGVGLGAPGALRSVIGAPLAVTVIGVIGLALGALLRNTAAGISSFVAVFFVFPPLMSLLPGSWSSTVAPYLPDHAGNALFAARPVPDDLGPWTGFAVLCAYAAVLAAAAAWQLKHRDT